MCKKEFHIRILGETIMSDTSNTLSPAIRQAVQAALQMQSNAPCEVCSHEPARPYAFAYAKKTGEISKTTPTFQMVEGSTTTTTRTYGPVEARVVNLCDSCVATQKKTMLGKSLLQIIISGLAAVLLIALSILFWLNRDLREILLFATIVPGILLLASIYQYRRRSPDAVAGSWKALSLHEGELKSQGYDSFWADLPD
jgi:hypothetical protein